MRGRGLQSSIPYTEGGWGYARSATHIPVGCARLPNLDIVLCRISGVSKCEGS